MRHLTPATILFALALAAPSVMADTPDYCPDVEGPTKVYAVGSSTMGSVLGPMLKRMFKAQGVKMNRWGKASSGLARPDFHDWPKLMPGLMRKHKPYIVVISMGSNDFQSIWHRKKWIGFGEDRWDEIYAERVDRMLKAAGGDNSHRLVVWEGPYAFKGNKARKRAPVVNRIMKERVAAYVKGGGKAVFIDAFEATTDAKGRPLDRAKLSGKKVDIRGGDGIHLTVDAVRALLAEPILEAVRPCLHPDEAVAAQADSDDDGGDKTEPDPPAERHEGKPDKGQGS
ncbi:MAG: hypothetical protein CSA66_00485 [Proteobacteria bacterium]|nr:MAG: hypothetical protein CSA66_00485 [Pseudomonadota bacterium]